MEVSSLQTRVSVYLSLSFCVFVSLIDVGLSISHYSILKSVELNPIGVLIIEWWSNPYLFIMLRLLSTILAVISVLLLVSFEKQIGLWLLAIWHIQQSIVLFILVG